MDSKKHMHRGSVPDPIHQTLFDKYGGVPGVRNIVREFHLRFIAKPTLNRYFDGIDPQKLIQHHAELISFAMGRPAPTFDQKKMPEQHHPRGITPSAFEAVINILRQVMLDANVEGKDIAMIINRMDMQRHNIVQNTSPYAQAYNPDHVDSLTGLGNREALDLVLAEEFAKYKESSRDLSLALLRAAPAPGRALSMSPAARQQIDRHLAGVLARVVRKADALSRFDNGVFALALRATGREMALKAAERIRSAAAKESYLLGAMPPELELPIGLVTLDDKLPNADALLEAAGRALEGAAMHTTQRIQVAA